MNLEIDLRTLLIDVAEGSARLDAVESWFQRHQEAVRADASAAFKSMVQDVLAQAWSWRHRRLTDGQARENVRALLNRLPE